MEDNNNPTNDDALAATGGEAPAPALATAPNAYPPSSYPPAYPPSPYPPPPAGAAGGPYPPTSQFPPGHPAHHQHHHHLHHDPNHPHHHLHHPHHDPNHPHHHMHHLHPSDPNHPHHHLHHQHHHHPDDPNDPNHPHHHHHHKRGIHHHIHHHFHRLHHHVRKHIHRLLGKPQLSEVDQMYDLGHKGYLTAAEQKVRDLDKENTGHVTNAMAVSIMEESIKLKHANNSLHRWIWFLMIFIICMGCATGGVSFYAAALAKDTKTSGAGLTVKENPDQPVVTISKGNLGTFQMQTQQDGRSGACVPVDQLNGMFNGMSVGTPTNIRLMEETAEPGSGGLPATSTVGLKAAGSGANQDGACLALQDDTGGPSNASSGNLCFNFGDFCDGENEVGSGRRLEPDEAADLHRHLFHRAVKGHPFSPYHYKPQTTPVTVVTPDGRQLQEEIPPDHCPDGVEYPEAVLDFQIACNNTNAVGEVIEDAVNGVLGWALLDNDRPDLGEEILFAEVKEVDIYTPILFTLSMRRCTDLTFQVTAKCTARAEDFEGTTTWPTHGACNLGVKDPQVRNFEFVSTLAWECGPRTGQEFAPAKPEFDKIQITRTVTVAEEALLKRLALLQRTGESALRSGGFVRPGTQRALTQEKDETRAQVHTENLDEAQLASSRSAIEST